MINNLGISAKIGIGLSFIIAGIFAITIISFNNTNKIIEYKNWVTHTQVVLRDLTEIESQIINLETGQRGFIITGNLNYLEPYNKSLGIIESLIQDLKELTIDNRSQTERIETLNQLVNSKINELDSTITLRKQDNGFAKAKEIVLTNEGKIIMDRIRIQIEKIRDEELRLLSIRNSSMIAKEHNSNKLFILIVVISLIISIVFIYIVTNTIITPIKSLIEGTKIVGQGNLEHKIQIRSKDEIGQLSKSFKAMLVNLKVSRNNLEEEIAFRKKAENELLKIKSRLEENLVQLEKSNDIKDKLFSIIGHDLKSPANSILAISGLLHDNYDNYSLDDKKEFIELIHISIQKMRNLIDDLVNWYSYQNVSTNIKLVELNLFSLSKEILSLFSVSAKRKSIRLHNKVPNDILIKADKNMLSTIIRNLVSNAIKFTPSKGAIELFSEYKEDEFGNQFVEVIVKDSGVGISTESQSKLFDLRQRTTTIGTEDEQGTGLGLGICKEFVEEHGGKIWLISEVDKGSAFHFTLPV